jgi:hypothetical protein
VVSHCTSEFTFYKKDVPVKVRGHAGLGCWFCEGAWDVFGHYREKQQKK